MKRHHLCLVVSMTFAAVVLCESRVAGVQRDSADFNFQYNGDRLPSEEGYTHMGTFATEPSSDGDILTFRTGIQSNSGYFLNTSEWASNIDPAVGYTLEWRIKLDEDFNAASGGAIGMVIQDTTSYRQFRLTKDRFFTTIAGSSDGEYGNLLSNSDGFHTFRVARPAGSDTWLAYRDGLHVGTAIGGGTPSISEFYWGDGSNGIGGPTLHVDYVRFDSTGAYEPVSTQVAGDFNGDGDVDGTDLGIWSANFGSSTGGTSSTGDTDDDGDVDGDDFLVWQANFSPAGASFAIPEPSALALAALACVAAYRRRLT